MARIDQRRIREYWKDMMDSGLIAEDETPSADA